MSLVSDDASTYVSITLTSTIDNESGKVGGGDDDRATKSAAIACYAVWVQREGEPVDETVNSFVRVRTGTLLLVKARVEPFCQTGGLKRDNRI
jgi:hypothetical protein